MTQTIAPPADDQEFRRRVLHSVLADEPIAPAELRRLVGQFVTGSSATVIDGGLAFRGLSTTIGRPPTSAAEEARSLDAAHQVLSALGGQRVEAQTRSADRASEIKRRLCTEIRDAGYSRPEWQSLLLLLEADQLLGSRAIAERRGWLSVAALDSATNEWNPTESSFLSAASNCPAVRKDAYHLAAEAAVRFDRQKALARAIVATVEVNDSQASTWPRTARATLVRWLWQTSKQPWRS